MRHLRVLEIASILLLGTVLAGCQSLPTPVPSGSGSPTSQGGGNQGGGSQGGSSNGDVDTSMVTGEPATDGLVDPCSLLTIEEVESATGVKVLGVVRGAVKNDGSQLCAYAMDAQGSTAAAMAGTPGVPAGGLGDVINGLKSGGAVVGVLLSAQDPSSDYGDSGNNGDTPSEVHAEKLALGKGGVVVATPNGGAAVVANDYNVLLTIMDLIAGPASTDTLTTLATTAFGRL